MAKKKFYYEFGEFQLDVRERALLRNGEALQLTPKAFDTLVVLVENAGSLVEKDEMMRVVWPDSFVEEIGLARNISVLRKALGQEAGGPQFIETVPKRGYRFTAPVHEHVDADDLIFEQSSLSQTVEIYREYSTNEGRAARATQSVDVAPSESVTPVSGIDPRKQIDVVRSEVKGGEATAGPTPESYLWQPTQGTMSADEPLTVEVPLGLHGGLFGRVGDIAEEIQ